MALLLHRLCTYVCVHVHMYLCMHLFPYTHIYVFSLCIRCVRMYVYIVLFLQPVSGESVARSHCRVD